MTSSAANGSVVVGYDATEHSDIALHWAVSYATAHRRPLLIVHAAGVPTVYESFTGPTENRKELRIAGRRTTDRALSLTQRQAPDLEVRVHMALGTPKDVLLDSLEGAHLLVVGSRGRGTLASLVLGSVSVGVAEHSPCPVAVIRKQKPRKEHSPFYGHIVAGIDGSDVSIGALNMAFEIASADHKGLVVVHSWGAAGVYRDMMSYQVRLETAEEHELQVAESIAGYAEKYPDVSIVQYQAEEDPARTLVMASESADLVVVGSRGRRDAAAVLLGSVSRYVVEHAQCPVIVVRRPG